MNEAEIKEFRKFWVDEVLTLQDNKETLPPHFKEFIAHVEAQTTAQNDQNDVSSKERINTLVNDLDK